MIKNLIFDMGNVLLDYDPLTYLKSELKDENEALRIYQELFQGPEWHLLDGGTISEEEIVLRVQRRIPEYAEDVGHIMDNWDYFLKPIAGMPELIAELKHKGWPLYLLTNAGLRFDRYSKRIKIFQNFDGLLVSAKEKLLKPDAAIYHLICKRYQLKPEECLFIDDLQDNVNGAVAVGMNAYRFIGVEELSQYLKQQELL